MTFYKTLKTAEKSGLTITAYEYTEKFSDCKNYKIIVSHDGIGLEQIPAARTTWQRKFNKALQEI